MFNERMKISIKFNGHRLTVLKTEARRKEDGKRNQGIKFMLETWKYKVRFSTICLPMTNVRINNHSVWTHFKKKKEKEKSPSWQCYIFEIQKTNSMPWHTTRPIKSRNLYDPVIFILHVMYCMNSTSEYTYVWLYLIKNNLAKTNLIYMCSTL